MFGQQTQFVITKNCKFSRNQITKFTKFDNHNTFIIMDLFINKYKRF